MSSAPVVSVWVGLLGSLVGGSATLAATWLTQRSLTTRELVQSEVHKRESLYGEFIAEMSKLLLDALSHSLERPDMLVPLYGLLNRIRLTASDQVLVEAERIVRAVAEQYFQPALSVEQLRAIAHSEKPDPLKPFAEACRIELKSLRPGI